MNKTIDYCKYHHYITKEGKIKSSLYFKDGKAYCALCKKIIYTKAPDNILTETIHREASSHNKVFNQFVKQCIIYSYIRR